MTVMCHAHDRPHFCACRATRRRGTPLGVAVALQPSLVQASRRVYCQVKLQGKLTRAQAVFDWQGIWKREPNVVLVQTVDVPAFHQLILESLAEQTMQ